MIDAHLLLPKKWIYLLMSSSLIGPSTTLFVLQRHLTWILKANWSLWLCQSQTGNILQEPFPDFNLFSKSVVEPHLSMSVEFAGSLLIIIEFDFEQQTSQIPASHLRVISGEVLFVRDELSVILKSKTFLISNERNRTYESIQFAKMMPKSSTTRWYITSYR